MAKKKGAKELEAELNGWGRAYNAAKRRGDKEAMAEAHAPRRMRFAKKLDGIMMKRPALQRKRAVRVNRPRLPVRPTSKTPR